MPDTIGEIVSYLKSIVSDEAWQRLVDRLAGGAHVGTGRFFSNDRYCIVGLCMPEDMLATYGGAMDDEAANKLSREPIQSDPFFNISMQWDSFAENVGFDRAENQLREAVLGHDHA